MKVTDPRLTEFIGMPDIPTTRAAILKAIRRHTVRPDFEYSITLRSSQCTFDMIVGIECSAMLTENQKWVLSALAARPAERFSYKVLIQSTHSPETAPRWINSKQASLYLHGVLESLVKRELVVFCGYYTMPEWRVSPDTVNEITHNMRSW